MLFFHCNQYNWYSSLVTINKIMNHLKKAIFIEIRKNQEDLELVEDDDLNKLIFHHPDGLRLSLTGFRIVKKIFTAYSFEIPKTIRNKHQYGMGQMEYPYYFTSKRLILFSEMDAMVIKLHGGVQGFLEMYSQSITD